MKGCMDPSIIVSWAVVAFVFLVITSYACARAASWGWHKQKLEHIKKVLHISKGEVDNGT